MSKTLPQKNTGKLLTWLPLVMLGGSLFLYIVLREHVYHMQNQQLELKQENIWNALQSSPDNLALHIKGEYDIEAGNPARFSLVGRQRDTVLYYPIGNHWDDFAMLTKSHQMGGHTYQITTYISSKEIKHMLIKVGLAEFLIFLLLLGTIVLVNRKSSRLLWAPFYRTMEAIRRYDVHKSKSLSLDSETGIEEFNQLNQTLQDSVDQIHKAYHNQKQFTENASHELQTPLAIIRSKVELMMDGPSLTEESAAHLGEINEANERLSQMNKNLLLLTRIDNNQFPQLESVHFSDLLQKFIRQYQEYYEGVLPLINAHIRPGVMLFANASLLEVLCNNLLRNAIMHNLPGGYVDIQLSERELVIENSGPILENDSHQLFERFKKGREESRTTGLGLALVKQICVLYHYDVQYIYSEGVHRLWVKFFEV